MLNDRIQNISKLQSALAWAEEYLSKLPPSTPYSEFEFEYATVYIFKWLSFSSLGIYHLEKNR